MNQITIIATDPVELEQTQKALVRHLDHRVAENEKMFAELTSNQEIAKRNGWRHDGLNRAMARQRKMVRYYTAIRAAVRAGYYIVPDMHAQVFAIRTDRKRPQQSESIWGDRRYHRQNARQLPPGEGAYKSPEPLIEPSDVAEDEQGVERQWYVPTKFDDVGFPVVGVKPQVMEATSRAMALKVFDEIGILPPAGCGDPLIIGIIRGPNYRAQHFVIAWWLDLEAI